MEQAAASQDYQPVDFELELEEPGILRLTWPRGASIKERDAQRAMDRVNEIANFFIGIMKPPCPTKFFTDETEALNWLINA